MWQWTHLTPGHGESLGIAHRSPHSASGAGTMCAQRTCINAVMEEMLRRTQRVSCLDHEALDDSMKDDAIKVAILGMGGEVFDGLRALLWKQLQSDVALGRVHDSSMR